MVVMEVEVPQKIAESFFESKQRISYADLRKKEQEIEATEWTDVMFDEPVPIEEFSVYLKKQIHG